MTSLKQILEDLRNCYAGSCSSSSHESALSFVIRALETRGARSCFNIRYTQPT